MYNNSKTRQISEKINRLRAAVLQIIQEAHSSRHSFDRITQATSALIALKHDRSLTQSDQESLEELEACLIVLQNESEDFLCPHQKRSHESGQTLGHRKRPSESKKIQSSQQPHQKKPHVLKATDTKTPPSHTTLTKTTQESRFNLILDFTTSEDSRFDQQMYRMGSSFLYDSYYQNRSKDINQTANTITALLFFTNTSAEKESQNLCDQVINDMIYLGLSHLLGKVIVKSSICSFIRDPNDSEYEQISSVLLRILSHLNIVANSCKYDSKQSRTNIEMMLKEPVVQFINTSGWESEETLIEFGSHNPIISYLINCIVNNEFSQGARLRKIDNSHPIWYVDKLLDLLYPEPKKTSSIFPQMTPVLNLHDLTVTQVITADVSCDLSNYMACGINQQTRRVSAPLSSNVDRRPIAHCGDKPWGDMPARVANGSTTFNKLLNDIKQWYQWIDVDASLGTQQAASQFLMQIVSLNFKNQLFLAHCAIQSLLSSRIDRSIEIGESVTIDCNYLNIIFQNVLTACLFAESPIFSADRVQRPILLRNSLPAHHFEIDGELAKGFCPVPTRQFDLAALYLWAKLNHSVNKQVILVDVDCNLTGQNPNTMFSDSLERQREDIKQPDKVYDLFLPCYPLTNEDPITIEQESFCYIPVPMVNQLGHEQVMLNLLSCLLQEIKDNDGAVLLQINLGYDSHIDEKASCSRPGSVSMIPSLRAMIPEDIHDIDQWFEMNRYQWCFTDDDFCRLYGFIHQVKQHYPYTDIIISREGGYNEQVLERHSLLFEDIIRNGLASTKLNETSKVTIHSLFSSDYTPTQMSIPRSVSP